MPLTGSYLCKMKARFLEIPTVCSESIMFYLFSNLRKRGVMNEEDYHDLCGHCVICWTCITNFASQCSRDYENL